MAKRFLAFVLAVYSLACLSPDAAGQTGHALLRVEGDWIEADGGTSLIRKLHFANEAVSYGLTYSISMPADLPPGRCTARSSVFRSGYIALGMNEPVAANWYTQGFLSIRVAGVSVHEVPCDFRAVRCAGADVLAEGTWSTTKGNVHLRLLLRSGDDKLLVQVALPPENEAQPLELRLLAYPQGFPEPRSRRAATATREFTPSTVVNLAELEQPWVFLYDDLYDKQHRGGGPCGLVYVPDEVESATTNLSSYSSTTTFRARPGGRTITVGLWDFTANREVATVQRYLRQAGPMICEDLARVAAADWSDGVPPVRLPKQYAEQLARRAAERHRPTPYDEMTMQVVTPHVKWARPLADGPVRTLVVGSRWAQRETVELAQRLDMDYQTVSFSGPDSLIDPSVMYLYGSYELYGYPRKNVTDVLYELTRKLALQRDCLILTGFRPEIVPEETRRDIVTKVDDGTGLVLFGYTRRMLDEFGDGLQKTAWEPGVVPSAVLPGVGHLVAEKRPVCEAYTFGKGRVLVFHYNTGNGGSGLAFTPNLTHEDPDVLGYYDYYHSLVACGVLWAAKREPAVRIGFDDNPGRATAHAREPLSGVTMEVMVHDPGRGVRRRAPAGKPFDLPQGAKLLALPAVGPATGPRLTSVWLRRGGKVVGWGTGYADLGDSAPSITAVDLSNTTLPPGATLTGTVRLGRVPEDGELQIELRDSLDRLLARESIVPTATAVRLELPLGRPVTILHEVRVRLRSGQRLLDQCRAYVTVPNRTVDDFYFLVWSSGQNHAVRHHINGALAAGGVDWIDNTGMTGGDAQRARLYCLNAARHNVASVPYVTRIASMQESGRQRRPCLHDARHVEPWAAGLEDRARGARPFGPPAYTLGDENFLVRRKLDVCITEPSLVAFRAALREQYGSLDRLNESWRSKHASWEEIVPPTFDEVRQTPDHWPRWADHRLFMDRTLTQAHAQGRDAIRRADPQARVGFDGVFSLDSWHGYDFYRLCRTCDLVQVYALRHPQVEYLRSWHLPGAVVGSWYNRLGNRDETSAKWMAWHLLLHGFNSSWYWTSYNAGPALLFPDLRPTPQFLWMQESIGEIKSGIGKLLLHARREHDGIAVHYSQASVHAGTLMDRNHAAAQAGFAQLVEDLGLQYDMLSSDEIRQGKLAEYNVLLMPASAAIGPAEAAAVRQLVGRGGMVVADTVAGLLDEHCRLLPKGRLDDLFGVHRSGLPDRGDQNVILSGKGLKGELPLTVYDRTLRGSAEAEAWGAAGDAAAVLVHKVGLGHVVVLNTAIEAYESLHKARAARSVVALMDRLLTLAGVRPQVAVTAAGSGSVDDCEIVRFTDGAIRYVAIVRDSQVAGSEPQDVSVKLPGAAHVYDVRAKRSLGHTDTVSTSLVPGDPKIYALLPYPLEGMAVAPVQADVRPGTPAGFQVALDFGGRKPAGRHCLRIEVFTPDGKLAPHYAQNMLVQALSTGVFVPLALDDPPGIWKLRATDVATGESATAALTVRGDKG